MDLNSRLSAKFFRRSRLLNNLEIPSISEVKAAIGAPLAKLIFNETHKDMKQYFGLIPPLKGPEGDLWVSPSDLLIGKVCLKPPLTQKHIKALTHEGICEIGSIIEAKFLNANRIENEASLREKEEYMLKLFELEKDLIIEEVEIKIKMSLAEETKQMKYDYEHQICSLLWQCGIQVEELENEMKTKISTTNSRWQQLLDDQIQTTTKRITEEFLIQLGHQEETLAECFNAKIKCLKREQKIHLEFERSKYKELLHQLLHKLQCQNIANLMYLLCKERHKCQEEKKIIQNACRSTCKEKDKIINRTNAKLKKISQQKKDAVKRIHVRERCLSAVLREFRKFIYFALKAVPTQGEFLLNIDKLLKFELLNYCPDKTKKETIHNEIKLLDKKEKTIELNEEILSDVEVEDESEPEKVKPIENNNELPMFYFNHRMYVREDFRDLESAGIKIDDNYPLWNPDVEEFLKVLRNASEQKVSNEKISKLRSRQSSVHFHSDKFSVETNEKARSQVFFNTSPSLSFEIKSSNMTNNTSSPTNQELEKMTLVGSPNPSNSSKKNLVLRSTSGKSSTKQLQKSQEYDITLPLKSPSKIVSARDSLILHLSTIERKSLYNVSTPIICDSGSNGKYLKEPKKEKSNKDLDSDTMKTHTSKLVLATDSLEIIKSTIAMINETTEETLRKKIPTPKRKKSPRIFTKPQTKIKNRTAYIFGDLKTTEHEKPDDVFVDERIKSLVRIMKESPSLMRLFTSCSQ